MISHRLAFIAPNSLFIKVQIARMSYPWNNYFLIPTTVFDYVNKLYVIYIYLNKKIWLIINLLWPIVWKLKVQFKKKIIDSIFFVCSDRDEY